MHISKVFFFSKSKYNKRNIILRNKQSSSSNLNANKAGILTKMNITENFNKIF